MLESLYAGSKEKKIIDQSPKTVAALMKHDAFVDIANKTGNHIEARFSIDSNDRMLDPEYSTTHALDALLRELEYIGWSFVSGMPPQSYVTS